MKPTLRVVQVVTMRGSPNDQVAYAIAEKQLYSSHYFETALDLSFCVRGSDDPAKPGFYLITAIPLPDCPPVASDRSEKATIVVSSILAATVPKPRLPRKEELDV